MLNSCSIDPLWYNNEGNEYGDINLDQKTKVDLLKISKLKFSNLLKKYTDVIRIIISDITRSHAAAAEFCENPEAYIALRGLDKLAPGLEFKLTDRDKKILMAMTDEQVLIAVKSRDFRAFINACIKKGYFSSARDILTVNIADLRKFFETEEDFAKYTQILQRINSANGIQTRSMAPQECAIGAPVVAVGFAAVEIGAFAHMAVKVKAYGVEASSNPIGVLNEPVMNLWYKENEITSPDDKVAFYEQVIDDRVNTAVEIITENFPNIDGDEAYSYIVNIFKTYYGYE